MKWLGELSDNDGTHTKDERDLKEEDHVSVNEHDTDSKEKIGNKKIECDLTVLMNPLTNQRTSTLEEMRQNGEKHALPGMYAHVLTI